ncbi:hypothetical protein NDU88_003051 [Pleurodeles waltl]|uniref:Uncharacterized protein n=1 Tax=Pleurodeles waltl TaxID=8319 RepID=A0AAV7WR94_PLEWA|nr:hypothetical protein NDU88_003051 [Pleurodeles waltl]
MEKGEPRSPWPKGENHNHILRLLLQARQEPLDQGNRGKGGEKTRRPRTGQGIGPQYTQREEPGEVKGKLGIQGGSKEIYCRDPPTVNLGKHLRSQDGLQGEHSTQEIQLMIQHTPNVNRP